MLKHKWFLALSLVCVIGIGRSEAQEAFSIRLKVIDEDGSKINTFEVLCHTHEYAWIRWKQGHKGELLLDAEHWDILDWGATCYQLIIRAPGYAPKILKLDNPKGDIKKEIVLHKGRRELILSTADGRAIPPSLEPIVVFKEFERRALLGYQSFSKNRTPADWNMTSLTKIKDGQYIFHVSDNAPEFYVFIDHPGFLRAFRAGPFNPKDLKDDRLEIELPEPATISVKFEPPENWVGELPFETCRCDIYWRGDEKTKGCPVVWVKSNEPRLSMEPEYFAPADYLVTFNTEPVKKELQNGLGEINRGDFHDRKELTLMEGQKETCVFKYIPYDELSYKGDYNAKVTVRWPDGRPAAGEPYFLYYTDKYYYGGALIQQGTLTSKGQLEMVRVKGGEDAASFMLDIRDWQLGRFSIKLEGEEKNRELSFTLAYKEGDKAPDITLLDVFKDKEVKLSEFRGKVIFLEFWATWCGPCRKPMAHLCETQTRKKTDWAEKVVLWAISIDDKKERLINHVQEQDLLAVRHLWCHEGEGGFKSKAATTYGISGVPTALLIDQKSKIVWRGNPESVDIEAKIDDLLKTRKKK